MEMEMERLSKLDLSSKESNSSEDFIEEETKPKSGKEDAHQGNDNYPDWNLFFGGLGGYKKNYALFRGDRSSGEKHHHRIVFNVKRDAFYMDGEWKDANDAKYKPMLKSLEREELPDDFQGNGVHCISEVYLAEGQVWREKVQKEVKKEVVVEGEDLDDCM